MIKNEGYSMKWFYYLIYFGLWVMAFNYLYEALCCFSGERIVEIDGVDKIIRTNLSGGMRIFEICQGVFCLIAVPLAIVTRMSLARYKKFAPVLVYILFLMPFISTTASYIISEIFADKHIVLYANFSGLLAILKYIITPAVLVWLNHTYFEARSELFKG